METPGTDITYIRSSTPIKGSKEAPFLSKSSSLNRQQLPVVPRSPGIIAHHGQSLRNQHLGDQTSIRKKEVAQESSVPVFPALRGLEAQSFALYQLSVAQKGLPGEGLRGTESGMEFRGVNPRIAQMVPARQDDGVPVNNPNHPDIAGRKGTRP